MALLNIVTSWLHNFGYGAVFVVLFAESLGIPSPSEIILLLSGYLIWNGQFNYLWVMVVGASGSTSGASVAYLLASRGGRRLLERRLRFLFPNPARVQYWEDYFARRGDVVVLIGRLISGVRLFISYPAGLFHMPWPKFLLYTIIGSLAWPALAAGAGWMLGPHVAGGLVLIHRYELPVLGALAVAAAVWAWARRRHPRPDEPTGRRRLGSSEPD